MRAIDLRDHRVEIPPPRRRRGCQQVGVLGKESDDRDLADHVVGASRCAIRGVAPWTPAHLDRRCEQRHLQTRPFVRAARVNGHPRERRAPADHLRIVAGTRRFTARDQMHRFEDVRFSSAVRTDECGDPRCEFYPSLLIAAEVLERDGGHAHRRRP